MEAGMDFALDGTARNGDGSAHALAQPHRQHECGSHSGLRWYCGQAKAGQVQIARDHLVRQGFEALVPLRARQAGHVIRIEPLLGPYFLVRFDRSKPGWRRIVSTRGVVRLFGTTPELPTPVRDADVEALRELRCDDWADPKPVGSGIKAGAPVRCAEGPYRGLTGLCLDVVSATVRCLLFTSAGPVDVDVPMRWCVRA
jgi:transcription antitermination factor NusG